MSEPIRIAPNDRAAMIEYIEYYDKEQHMNAATDEEIRRFRECVDALCEEHEPAALYIKAYACYGGNRAYPCDFYVSRDLLLELMEIDSDPFIANTLGYIYYYGRCNDGNPEYDKAFYYYSIGAAGGVYESRYKLADHFVHGYGVPKNLKIAENIITELYSENLEYIKRNHFNTKFADVALRMGNIYSRRESEEIPYKDLAYYYYLQADYAIRMRMLEGDYYGDQKVAWGIKKAIEKVLPETSYVKKKQKAKYFFLSNLIGSAYYDKFLLQMTILGEKKNGIKVRITLIPRDDIDVTPKFFITIPEAHFCGLLEELDLTFKPCDDITIFDKKYEGGEATFIFDEIDDYTFLLNGTVVAEMPGPWKIKVKKEKKEKKYRFASIAFDDSDRRYEYLCEDPKIKEGDWVYAESNKDPKKVCVMKVYEKKESELPFLIERYKKVFRTL